MLAIAGFAAAVFAYGFAAGSYRLPPFYQIAWLKNNLAERFFPSEVEYEPETAKSATQARRIQTITRPDRWLIEIPGPAGGSRADAPFPGAHL